MVDMLSCGRLEPGLPFVRRDPASDRERAGSVLWLVIEGHNTAVLGDGKAVKELGGGNCWLSGYEHTHEWWQAVNQSLISFSSCIVAFHRQRANTFDHQI